MTTTTSTTSSAATSAVSRLRKAAAAVLVGGGVLLFAAGATTWALVGAKLSAENITVADDASHFAGKAVRGPLTAYFEADIIAHHAAEATGGKTYAELDREDPLRAVAMNASFLRASLFTSVVSFGIAALASMIGVLFALCGMLFWRRS